jgi:hypothetical protein
MRKLCYCSKTDLGRDTVKDLAGDIARDFVGNLVAKKICYCSKPDLLGYIVGEHVAKK